MGNPGYQFFIGQGAGHPQLVVLDLDEAPALAVEHHPEELPIRRPPEVLVDPHLAPHHQVFFEFEGSAPGSRTSRAGQSRPRPGDVGARRA